jgi:acetyltransferase-like isoleucine patch superfamily enzyme
MGFKIGKGSSIHIGCKFNAARLFELGLNSTINQFCRLDNRGGIFIGDNVSISPYAKLLTADHNINHPECTGRNRKIVIDDYVFIGSDAMVLGGVEMKKGSVLAAKSLLTKSTKPFGIYMGIPAYYKSDRNETINYSGSYVRWFN